MNIAQLQQLLNDSDRKYNIIESLDAVNKFKAPNQMSEFYKGEDANGNFVFIKCFDFRFSTMGNYKKYYQPQFESQIKFLENITHNRPDLGVFKIRDHFTCVLSDEVAKKDFDIIFCVFEYIEGRTLSQIIVEGINEGRFLEIELIHRYAKEIIDVLTYVHLQEEQSIGLISPHNIYVSDTFNPNSQNIFIINFDTSGKIKDIGDGSVIQNFDKFLDFCPEDLFNLEERKPSLDIYCLSTTLYYALTNIQKTSLLREDNRSTNPLKSISYYRDDFRDNAFINESAIFKAINILEDERYDDVREFSKNLLIPKKDDESSNENTRDLVKDISKKIKELNRLTKIYERKVQEKTIKSFDLNIETTKILLLDLEDIIKSIDSSRHFSSNTNTVVTGESSNSSEKLGFADYILVCTVSFLATALPSVFIKSQVLPNSLPFWILLFTNILMVLSTIKFDFRIISWLLRFAWLPSFLLVVLFSDSNKFIALVLGLLSVIAVYQYYSKSRKIFKPKSQSYSTKLTQLITQPIEKIVKMKGEIISWYILASCFLGLIFGVVLSTLTGRAGG